ncbi:hypothetical protein ECG_01586 [Echinococcus granulosus]|uniref:Expressed protein n=1 Tax=Echinococcus granulosus TaxID=6210 RepID=A0A068W7W1_ECHGR|nr:hypothetical protein ECG_01586 [Echinococcus granulosus]CDS15484.1 expressed protein [Echinococcus granulosus]
MSCRDIRKFLKKVEEDNQSVPTEPPSKPITFACAKLCLKEMLDTYEYLGPNRYIDESKKEIETPIQAIPPCKYGQYGDLHAPCSTPNQTSQRTRPTQSFQQQQQDSARKQQRQSTQQKPRK